MGLLRLFLALCVIAGHSGTAVFGFNGIGAWYAVNFFFIISGFYMAMVLNEKYADIKILDFYKSRIFRIFPVYYVGLFLTLLVSFESISEFFGTLTISSKFFYIFQNLFIFGQDLSYIVCTRTLDFSCAPPVPLTINLAAWSLSVELGFYLIAPFILKSQKRTFAFVVAGAIYFLCVNQLRFPLNYFDYFRAANITGFTYFFYPSSFIFFGGGALAYHFSKEKSAPNYGIALFALILLSYAQSIMPSWHLFFIGLAIPVLFSYTKKNRIDRVIGELSYPVYILHMPILLFIRPLTLSHPEYFKVISLGTWVSIISIVLGIFLYYVIEIKVSRYRHSEKFFSTVSPCDEAGGKGSGAYRSFRLASVFYIFVPFACVIYLYAIQQTDAYKNTIAACNLTDVNWVNGIGRKFSGYFVVNTPEVRKNHSIGGRVKLADGEVRKVVNIIESEKYINIYLDGSPMDGNQVGYPHKIEIVK